MGDRHAVRRRLVSGPSFPLVKNQGDDMLNLKTQVALSTLSALMVAGVAGAATTNGLANGGFEMPRAAAARSPLAG